MSGTYLHSAKYWFVKYKKPQFSYLPIKDNVKTKPSACPYIDVKSSRFLAICCYYAGEGGGKVVVVNLDTNSLNMRQMSTNSCNSLVRAQIAEYGRS